MTCPCDSAGRHIISKLTLTDFRNYASLSLDLDPGAGRASAATMAPARPICWRPSRCLSPGRGLRRATYAEVAREARRRLCRPCAARRPPMAPATSAPAPAGRGAGGGEAGRRVRINGATRSSADDLLEWLRVLWLTPAMDALFTGPAGDRRRFLDRLVLAIDPQPRPARARLRKGDAGPQPAACRRLARPRLVRGDRDADGRVRRGHRRGARRNGAAADGDDRQAARRRPLPAGAISLAGSLETLVGEHAGGRGRGELSRGAGRRAANATAPPGARWRDRTAPTSSSATGRRTCRPNSARPASRRRCWSASCCRMRGSAARCRAAAPILLLDEIAAHLDAGRRAALFSILEELGCQTFMTGTDARCFRASRAARSS